MRRPGRVQSIERAIDLLMALKEGPRTLTDLSRAAGLSKATAFRLLATLSYQNLVAKDGSANLYMLGAGSLALLQGVTAGLGAIVSGGRPSLRKLWQSCQETVTVHVRIDTERICVDELPSPHPIRYIAAVGATVPLYVGAAGKVMLAKLEPSQLASILSRMTLTPITDKTFTDRDSLMRELIRIRAQGYATSAGERVPGAASISVAVEGPNGVLAAVSILGPANRLTRAKQLEQLPALQLAARDISEALSGAPDLAARKTVAGVHG